MSIDLTTAIAAILHNEGDGGIWETFDRKNSETVAAVLGAALEARGFGHVADAVDEMAARWQTGEWSALTEPIKSPTQPQRIIGAAQAVTDWMRRYSRDLRRAA